MTRKQASPQQTTKRLRSPDPDQKAKRVKTSSQSDGARFTTGLLESSNVERLHLEYKSSAPFKHSVVDKLFSGDLLVKVKDEILKNIRFTEKETDIYKVHQTGDLASLSYLTPEQLALFPSLVTLRDALYSQTFRQFIRGVTGCGHLSGSKQDMSVNSYKKGCHLLNHDDVIGTRRVSYILYMPLPHRGPWNAEFGGALELYPVTESASGGLEPLPTPSKVIPPDWNQFVFFEVQPGRSFHSVEEVVVGTDDDGRQRLSISGWFHKPVEGEEGYEPESTTREKSSLEQLSSASTSLTPYPSDPPANLPSTPLTEEETTFLSQYLHPVYLSSKTLEALASRFASESSLELHSFLCEGLSSQLESLLRANDKEDGYLGSSRQGRVPKHTSGQGADNEWVITGPPHKQRYCVLSQSARQAPIPNPSDSSASSILRSLQDSLLPSSAFRSWLALVSSLLPLGYMVEARRFRPGLDYTLARSEERDARLDISLSLTPKAEHAEEGWESGNWGGWECYMAPHEGDDDPAVYRSGSKKQKQDDDNEMADGPEDEDDGTLLVSQPGFNRLLLVLRDQGVMRFVKYVSAVAQGSRWDVSGEWEVGDVEVGTDSENE